MGTNQRRFDRIEQRARDASTEVAERDARRILAIWNARRAKGRDLWFHLMSGAAIAAGHPWLTFICPGCQQIGEIDLRSLDRHPNATIESLVLSLACRRCQPNPPHVKLLGLGKLPTYRWRCVSRTFSKLAVSGLALMYPAFWLEHSLPAIMDINPLGGHYQTGSR